MKSSSITRRDFLKGVAAGATALSAPILSSCHDGDAKANVPGLSEPGEMTYRINPRNGDRISILGYGCMRFEMKTENGQEVVDQDSVDELIDYAYKHGVNYFDTAPVYLQGLSEQAVGKALKRYDRSSFFLATKLSTHRGGVFGGHLTPKEMFDASIALYESSFENLQTNYFDYYLLHNIASIEAYEMRFKNSGVMDHMIKEKEAGRIRNLGCSVHCDKETFDYVLEQYDWDFVQIQMNYYDWDVANAMGITARYMYEELAKRNIPVVIMEPILGGRLAAVDYQAINELRASKPGSSAASWAFRFCGTQPGVLSCLSGMTYMEHLQDNVRTFAPLEPLSQEQETSLLEMAKVMASYPLIQCNSCQYCMPCPYGLDIPSILTHYNKCVREGNFVEDASDSEYRKARRAFLIGYDRSVPKLRQASHCAGCQQCVPDCPQSIDIPSELRRIDEFVEGLKRHSLGL